MKFTLLTCTHDRQNTLPLCCDYIRRQTRKPDRWVVVDDGEVPVDPLALCEMAGIMPVYLRREKRAHHPQIAHTLPLNIHEALHTSALTAEDDIIVFWEDDDWYAPSYLAWIEETARVTAEQIPLIIGQSHAPYYRLVAREWMDCENIFHASLAATAISSLLLPVLDDVCYITHTPFVDLRLWQKVTPMRKVLRPHPYVVGIKQMPGGWQGTTMGWKGGENFLSDPHGEKLRKLVGEADAKRYMDIVEKAAHT
jgi:glycosyltransferase involved in cell wall biosynthesis